MTRGRKAKAVSTELAARVLDVTPAEYHTDPLPSPSLSSSIAHAIVSESPLHGWTLHPKFGGAARGATKAKDGGSILHRLLLGRGAALAVIDAPDFRAKEAREQRDAAIAAGKVPVKLAELQQLSEVAGKIRDRCLAQGFAFDGESEVAVGWYEQGEKGPVLCRSMFDHVYMDRGVIYDVKRVSSANPRDCARHFVEYGYDIAYTAYTRALAKLRPELEGRIEMIYLYCETEPPYSVVPARPDGAFREIGAQRWSRAVALWERGLATGSWPGYCSGEPVTLSPPQYVIRDELGELGAEYL